MSKVTATLGRNFIRSKEFQEAQMMGLDPVSYALQYILSYALLLSYALQYILT
jgi:hypothetical protein